MQHITEFSPINWAFFKKEDDNHSVGITQTSANHLANIAKHKYEAIEKFLQNIKLFTINMQVIGSPTTHTIQTETENLSEEVIKFNLLNVSNLKSFIAFLREAIKYKDNLLNEINTFFIENKDLEQPVQPIKLSEQEVIDTWDTGKRRKYLELETKAAIIGKYIHPSQPFYNKRENFFEQNRTEVAANGRDTLIYSYTSNYTNEKIDNIFLALQAEHRKYEAELNGMKNEIKLTIDKDFIDKMNIYNEELERYKVKVSEINKEQTLIKEARLKEISSLKILIPEIYKPLYEELKSN